MQRAPMTAIASGLSMSPRSLSVGRGSIPTRRRARSSGPAGGGASRPDERLGQSSPSPGVLTKSSIRMPFLATIRCR